MRLALIVCLAVLAACTEEPRDNDFPPPPRGAPPASHEVHAPREARSAPLSLASAPALKVGNVKPLRLGLLTTKNVGDYMDAEERELRAALRGSGAGVARPGDTIDIYLRDDILFRGKTPELSPRAVEILSAVATVVVKYDSTFLSIEGYSDTAGTSEAEMQSSQERADVVAHALVATGIGSNRISAHGFGATHLKIPTGPDRREPRNRRIEIAITPKMAT